MASSYDKIYLRMLDETEDGKALTTMVSKAYNEARIIRYSFELRMLGGVPFAEPRFHTNFHHPGGSHQFGSVSHCGVRNLFEPDDLTNLARRNFGSTVPTFFCLPNTVFGENSGKKRGRKDAPSFRSWAQDVLMERFSEIQLATQKRLDEMAKIIQETPAFQAEGKEALIRFAMGEITRVLRSYSFLGDDVLREALREFHIEEVMES